MKKITLFNVVLLSILFSEAQWKLLPGKFTTTSPYGFGISNIVFDKKGNMYVAGEFKDSITASLYVAKWDGKVWSKLPGSINPSFGGCGLPVICSLAIDSADNIYATAGTNIAKWDGNNWSILYTQLTEPITKIIADNKGNLYVTSLTVNKNNTAFITKWDGIKWTVLDTIPSTTKYQGSAWINQLATDQSGNVYAAGYMTDSAKNNYIAKWDGKKWSSLGDISNVIPSCPFGSAPWLNSLYIDHKGNVYVSGSIISINYNPANHYRGSIAKWDGTNWTALGGSKDSTFNNQTGCYSVTSDANGNIYASSYFTKGSVSNYNVAK